MKPDVDIKRILCNPIYVGIGPYARIVDEDHWVKGNEKLIREIGAEAWLRLMLEELRKAMQETTP